MDSNRILDLDGWCHGPLFAPVRKVRELARPKGLQGTVRRRQERDRTPPWADRKAIRALYKEAKRLTRETGELHVVDHIVPLIGKWNGAHIVDGLHWEGNMRVLHWLANNQKGNFWWPDAQFEQLELL